MKKKHLKILLCLALLGAGLLCALAFKFFRHEEAPTFSPPPTAQYKKELKALTKQVQGKLVFERTQKNRERLPDIFTMQLGDNRPKKIAEGGRRPKWSPDGSKVLFVRNNDIIVVDANGKNEKRIASSGHGESAAWFPNGKEVAFSDFKKVHVVNLASGEVRELLTIKDQFRELAISPDGQFMAATVKRLGGYTVRHYDLRKGERIGVLGKGCSPSFSPDGKFVTNNRHRHVELYIIEAATKKHVDTVTAPAGYKFDNQIWSNHPDYMTSVIEGAINEIFIHHIWDDTKTQVTAFGDCDYPDLFVE